MIKKKKTKFHSESIFEFKDVLLSIKIYQYEEKLSDECQTLDILSYSSPLTYIFKLCINDGHN